MLCIPKWFLRTTVNPTFVNSPKVKGFQHNISSCISGYLIYLSDFQTLALDLGEPSSEAIEQAYQGRLGHTCMGECSQQQHLPSDQNNTTLVTSPEAKCPLSLPVLHLHSALCEGTSCLPEFGMWGLWTCLFKCLSWVSSAPSHVLWEFLPLDHLCFVFLTSTVHSKSKSLTACQAIVNGDAYTSISLVLPVFRP